MMPKTHDVRMFSSRAIEALRNIIECIELSPDRPVSVNQIVDCLVHYSKKDYSDICECDSCLENHIALYR